MYYRDWLSQWFEYYVQPTLKDKTCYLYKEIINKHLIPSLGNYQLNEITPLILQSYINRLLRNGNLKNGKGLSGNSVNIIINVIQSSLRMANILEYSQYYYADKIQRPRVKEKAIDCFNIIEQKEIEAEVLVNLDRKPKLFGVLLCLYTGLRIGELLALEWEDINLQDSEIHVTKSCFDGADINGAYMRKIDSPKTQLSQRVIPLPKQIIPILKEHKKRSGSAKNVVFSSSGNNVISIRSYQKSFELLQKKIDISRKGFHSLRHTFATRALECGMDIKTLSEILGHKNAIITLNRYVHSLSEHKKNMMNKLGKLF